MKKIIFLLIAVGLILLGFVAGEVFFCIAMFKIHWLCGAMVTCICTSFDALVGASLIEKFND